MRNFNKSSNPAAATGTMSEMKKSPFRLYHLADGTFVPEGDEEADGRQDTVAENGLLRVRWTEYINPLYDIMRYYI